jgi:hypothetical protein
MGMNKALLTIVAFMTYMVTLKSALPMQPQCFHC